MLALAAVEGGGADGVARKGVRKLARERERENANANEVEERGCEGAGVRR